MIQGKNLKNKVVIIAGATGLIGKAIAKSFVECGSKIIITSRDSKKGKLLQDELNKLKKGNTAFCQLDISDESSIENLIKFAIDSFDKIDVFINCSWPMTPDWMANVEEVKFSSIKENLVNHLGGYFLCTQKMAIQMKKQRFGSIINFSSIYGIVGPNFSIYDGTKMTCPPAYPLIKGGIIAMTKYFATYFAKDNVRINCIAPGGVFNGQDKEFVKKYEKLAPLGRMAKPEEIVGTALFMASSDSAYITGQCILVDGGWTAW